MHAGALWRDGRAAEGACLENMFGVTPNVGSNPTPSARRFAIDDLQIVNLQA